MTKLTEETVRGKELGEECTFIFSNTKELNVVKLCENNREFIFFPI
jgi:hypothetical protein